MPQRVKIAFSGTVADLLSAKNNRLYSLSRVDGFGLSKVLLQLYDNTFWLAQISRKITNNEINIFKLVKLKHETIFSNGPSELERVKAELPKVGIFFSLNFLP